MSPKESLSIKKSGSACPAVVTFWQTAGLFLLSKILLTGVAPRGHYHRRGDWRKKDHGKYGYGCREDEKTGTIELLYK